MEGGLPTDEATRATGIDAPVTDVSVVLLELKQRKSIGSSEADRAAVPLISAAKRSSLHGTPLNTAPFAVWLDNAVGSRHPHQRSYKNERSNVYAGPHNYLERLTATHDCPAAFDAGSSARVK